MARSSSVARAVAHEQGVSEKWARLQGKKPIEHRELIALSDATAAELNAAEAEVDRCRMLDGGVETNRALLRRAEQRLEQARAAVREDSVELVFRPLPRARYTEILREFTPTPEEIEQAKADGKPVPEMDLDGLTPLLLSEVVVDPKQTAEEWHALFADPESPWGAGETAALYLTAMSVCQRRRAVDLGNG